MNPTTVPGTRRQQVVATSGKVLERQNIYLPPEAWEALRRLAITTHRSTHETLEHLIAIASSGSPVKENLNDSTSTIACVRSPKRDA